MAGVTSIQHVAQSVMSQSIRTLSIVTDRGLSVSEYSYVVHTACTAL